MRYFIHLAYDGTNYRGWQWQKNNDKTVQEQLETVLSRIIKKPISIYGCGRTDAGVHASQYVMQINLDEAPSFDLQFRLNKNLPDDIAIYDIVEVEPDRHCRYHAVERTYDYFIHTKKDPILYRHSSMYDDILLDYDLMKQAAALIQQTHDFRPLCKQPDLYDNTLCRIMNCELFINEEKDRLRFTITANRFLRGMIRYCVFFLLEVGKGDMTIETFDQILQQKAECPIKKPAYPNGLFLSRVKYPFIEFENKHHLIDMLKVGLE